MFILYIDVWTKHISSLKSIILLPLDMWKVCIYKNAGILYNFHSLITMKHWNLPWWATLTCTISAKNFLKNFWLCKKKILWHIKLINNYRPSSLTEFRQSKREMGSRKHTILCLPPSHFLPSFRPSTDGAKLGKLSPSYGNLGDTFPRVQAALPLDNKRIRCCQQGRIFLNFLHTFPFFPITCNIILAPRVIYFSL